MFREIPKSRTCQSAGIPKFYCPCYQVKEIEIDSKFSRQLASDLVDNINGMMRKRKYDSKCELLQVEKIHQVTEMISTAGLSSNPHREMYKTVIQTRPGHGIFEGFLNYDRKLNKSIFEEGISRLNLYCLLYTSDAADE